MNMSFLLSVSIRPYVFRGFMVRLVVPPRTIGAYVLYGHRNGDLAPYYVGHSIDLRRRLLEHRHRPLNYFAFQPCETRRQACALEARVFRLLKTPLNQIAPSLPTIDFINN